MDEFLAARMQMGVSLGFHIVFACIGMVMPWFMFVAEWKWLKTNNPVYLDLAKAWAKGVAIFFAVGAVSGTVLSFELGMLWPTFMEHAGPIFGLPFSWEGTAFFLEAIALGLFLYGWNRLNKWVHLYTGLVVGIAGVLSGIFVVSANAWMNAPAGFDWVNGQAENIDPVKAMFNKAWLAQAHHMTIAAFSATGFAVAGVHALLFLKNKLEIHAKAITIALSFAAVAALLQPISGDLAAKNVAKLQPAKLAAFESHFKTTNRAPLIIGGIPDVENEDVKHAIKLPGFLSFLAHGDFNAEVKGLEEFPREEWPPIPIVHYSFQLMVAIGMFLALLGVIFLAGSFKWKHWLGKKWWMKLLTIATPLGFIAVEAGWIVTEVGRQPWIIYGIMKTRDSLTPMPGIQYTFYTITAVYLLLSFIVIWLLSRQIKVLQSKYLSHD
ncbi:cytochrome bd-I ubiquinol oxidase subunit 1 apoprotein [Tangfeifania diversioriginum]|uniref:Cytochrome bd-I ubiquinol oxidase subunit 1 apoprotein n=1 Tax=Tangfeifania diversioriginum TaxID=1168035 RepID=A0A1M6DQ35_9BACT|nr:cytochrome ubiquinol oxidase subunit I [Tangfeifania diversioriginum]SHI75273.1 cytochrome bd-I ubiquinol oxidase subunit 1 apoprotein [Tangfeifania diversioriginum]